MAQLIYKTARVLREREIDIVDGRASMGTVVATLAGRLAGVRAVISTNWYPEVTFRSPGWSMVGRGIYVLVDAIISDSVSCLDDMRKWMIFPPPGYCIPNGIKPPQTRRSSEDVATELAIPPGAKVVAQIARLVPTKGQILLLEAAPLILARHPEAFFLLVGYSNYTLAHHDYRNQLDLMIKKQGIGHRVRIVSYPGEIGDIWQLIDIHAHPTLLDSSPIAVLEGMSLGKPVVTSRIGGIPELVMDRETGILIPPGDVKMLATAILRLLQDPGEASRLGRNAKRSYETNHTPDVMARRIEEVFECAYEARRGFRGRNT